MKHAVIAIMAELEAFCREVLATAYECATALKLPVLNRTEIIKLAMTKAFKNEGKAPTATECAEMLADDRGKYIDELFEKRSDAIFSIMTPEVKTLEEKFADLFKQQSTIFHDKLVTSCHEHPDAFIAVKGFNNDGFNVKYGTINSLEIVASFYYQLRCLFAHGNSERARKAFDTLDFSGCFSSDKDNLELAHKYFRNLSEWARKLELTLNYRDYLACRSFAIGYSNVVTDALIKTLFPSEPEANTSTVPEWRR